MAHDKSTSEIKMGIHSLIFLFLLNLVKVQIYAASNCTSLVCSLNLQEKEIFEIKASNYYEKLLKTHIQSQNFGLERFRSCNTSHEALIYVQALLINNLPNESVRDALKFFQGETGINCSENSHFEDYYLKNQKIRESQSNYNVSNFSSLDDHQPKSYPKNDPESAPILSSLGSDEVSDLIYKQSLKVSKLVDELSTKKKENQGGPFIKFLNKFEETAHQYVIPKNYSYSSFASILDKEEMKVSEDPYEMNLPFIVNNLENIKPLDSSTSNSPPMKLLNAFIGSGFNTVIKMMQEKQKLNSPPSQSNQLDNPKLNSYGLIAHTQRRLKLTQTMSTFDTLNLNNLKGLGFPNNDSKANLLPKSLRETFGSHQEYPYNLNHDTLLALKAGCDCEFYKSGVSCPLESTEFQVECISYKVSDPANPTLFTNVMRGLDIALSHNPSTIIFPLRLKSSKNTTNELQSSLVLRNLLSNASKHSSLLIWTSENAAELEAPYNSIKPAASLKFDNTSSFPIQVYSKNKFGPDIRNTIEIFNSDMNILGQSYSGPALSAAQIVGFYNLMQMRNLNSKLEYASKSLNSYGPSSPDPTLKTQKSNLFDSNLRLLNPDISNHSTLSGQAYPSNSEGTIGAAGALYNASSQVFNFVDIPEILALVQLFNSPLYQWSRGIPKPNSNKTEILPLPAAPNPITSCASEGMTCCIPEPSVPKWQSGPDQLPYLNGRTSSLECKTRYNSLLNALCATTLYKDTNCGIQKIESRDYIIFQNRLHNPEPTMNNAICQCKYIKHLEPEVLTQNNIKTAGNRLDQSFPVEHLHLLESQASSKWEYTIDLLNNMMSEGISHETEPSGPLPQSGVEWFNTIKGLVEGIGSRIFSQQQAQPPYRLLNSKKDASPLQISASKTALDDFKYDFLSQSSTFDPRLPQKSLVSWPVHCEAYNPNCLKFEKEETLNSFHCDPIIIIKNSCPVNKLGLQYLNSHNLQSNILEPSYHHGMRILCTLKLVPHDQKSIENQCNTVQHFDDNYETISRINRLDHLIRHSSQLFAPPDTSSLNTFNTTPYVQDEHLEGKYNFNSSSVSSFGTTNQLKRLLELYDLITVADDDFLLMTLKMAIQPDQVDETLNYKILGTTAEKIDIKSIDQYLLAKTVKEHSSKFDSPSNYKFKAFHNIFNSDINLKLEENIETHHENFTNQLLHSQRSIPNCYLLIFDDLLTRKILAISDTQSKRYMFLNLNSSNIFLEFYVNSYLSKGPESLDKLCAPIQFNNYSFDQFFFSSPTSRASLPTFQFSNNYLLLES